MTQLLEEPAGRVAMAVTAAGLVAGLLALAVTRRPGLALKVFLDFLLAAGLLRLTGDPGWPAVVAAAAIVALRRLIGAGLRAGAAAWSSGRDEPTGRRGPRHRGEGRRTGPAGPPRRLAVDRLMRPAWRL